MAKVNKHDISKAVYEVHGGLSFAQAQEIVDAILDIIKERLRRGEKVLLSGFGCFRVVERKARRGADPRSGRPITIAARKAVKFSPSKRWESP